LAYRTVVPFRKVVSRSLAGLLILLTALLSVGLTASEDGPFSIGIRPVFLRLDPQSIAASRAHVFGLDVDVKVGSMHLHIGWSAIPLTPASTKAPSSLL
jgi:hypothetical protein